MPLWRRPSSIPGAKGQLTDTPLDLARRVRELCDMLFKKFRIKPQHKKRIKGSGSADDPIVMPKGTGVVAVAKKIQQSRPGTGEVRIST